MHSLENLMYQISGLFLPPVLVVIVILFFYSIFALGDFFTQYFLRKKNEDHYLNTLEFLLQRKPDDQKTRAIKGYDLFNFAIQQKSVTQDSLSVHALKNLESLRVVTRIAPMLGLVATMIPMGPALKSLASGNIQGISENLIVAFSAVIFGLIVASVTFWIATIKKRWLASEMIYILDTHKQEI